MYDLISYWVHIYIYILHTHTNPWVDSRLTLQKNRDASYHTEHWDNLIHIETSKGADEHQIAFKNRAWKGQIVQRGALVIPDWLPSFLRRVKGGIIGRFLRYCIWAFLERWRGLFACHFDILSLMWSPSPAEFMRTIHLGHLAIDSVRWICWLRKGNTLSDRMLSSSGSSRRPARDAICICPQFCGDLRITKMPSRLRACPRLWKRSLRNLQECSHFKDHHRICSNPNCETQRSDKDTN